MEQTDARRDVSAAILQNILQIGHLDYGRVTEYLVRLTDSKTAQFFEKSQTGSIFVCRYSNTDAYVIGEKYTTYNLPYNQYAIFHRNNVIAIISLDNQDPLDDLPDDMQQRIHDSICVGLVMGTLQDSKYVFTMSVCNALNNIVSQVIDMFDSITPKVRSDQKYVDQINSHLNDVIQIIVDTIDYLQIDAEKIELQNNIVNMEAFVREVQEKMSSIFLYNLTIDMEDRAKRNFVFDKRWVQQMLISVLKRLVDIPGLILQVSYNTGVLIFHVTSLATKQNQEMVKRFQVDRVSVSTLDIVVVKRLCEIMRGKAELEDGIALTIAVREARI